MPFLENNNASGPAPSHPAPAPPLPPPPRLPSLALAAASCLRHEGLRSAWGLAGFGDRAPWQKLWEAAFADGEEDEDEDEEEEEEEEGREGGDGREGGGGQGDDFDVDREPPVVRLAASLAAREKVQAEVCGPRCVGAGCIVAATEIDAALGRGGGGDPRRRRQPLRAALAALLADVERREAGGGGGGGGGARTSSLLRHCPDASLPPAPSPRFVPLPSHAEAIREIDEALASGARLVALLSAGGGGAQGEGGKTTVAAAAARAFLRRARQGAEDGEAGEASGGLSSVSTSWDGAFWLDARGLEGGEDDVFSASSSSESPSSAATDADDDDDDEDPSVAAFRALLAALGGSAVPGTPDRDRVLLRARSLFGDAAASSAGGGGGGFFGGGRAPGRTAGLVVRMGERRCRRRPRQRGLLSALLELLDASAGLSVIVVGGMEDEKSGPFAPEATVVLRPPSQAEARRFLREESGAAAAAAREGEEERETGSGGADEEDLELPPPLRDVRVLRAAAALGIKAPRALLEEALGGGISVGESSSLRRALGSLLVRRAPAALLLRLSRLSSALLCGRGGTFTCFAASTAFNCDTEKALEYLRELQALGLAHPAEAASAAAAAEGAAVSAASSSSSSFSPSVSSASASWTLSSLAASVGQDLSEKLGASPSSSSSFSSLVTLARIAEAATATLETSLAFARGGSGGGGGERSNTNPRARFPATTGGHALASHWISKERALFSSAPMLAKRLLRRELEAPKQEEEKTSENERVLLSSVALSSLSMLLWRGGDKLLPGLLGFGVHASLARDVETAAAVKAAAAAAAAGGNEERGRESGFRAIAARASWSLGAALCSRGRWQQARDPLLRALRDSSAGGLPESGENGRHRIVSWIARVEYKVNGDLGSAADFYARAAARASSNGNSSSSSSPLPLEASAASASPTSPPDPLALEQEAEALEGAAGLLRSRGNDADALACYRASLAARAAAAAAAAAATRSPSPSPSLPALLSLSAASAANNAAVLLVAAGARAAALGDADAAARRYREAERLYAQVLEAREALLGPEDPAVAATLFNAAALAARRGLRDEAREGLQRAAAIREYALGARSAELAEVNAALALWPVSETSVVSSAAGVEGGSKGKAKSSSPSSPSSPSSLCISRREARAHARAALSVFEELEQGGEAASEAVRARHAARVAQLQGFLFENR